MRIWHEVMRHVMYIWRESVRRVRLGHLRVRYFEVEFAKRPRGEWPDEEPGWEKDDWRQNGWENELYEVIPEDTDPQDVVNLRNFFDSKFEWRVYFDMRGNRDYETDAFGNFLYRNEYDDLGGNPGVWREKRRCVRSALRARRAAAILRRLGIDVVARQDVREFRWDVSIPTLDFIYLSKPAYGTLRHVAELPKEYWTDPRFE